MALILSGLADVAWAFALKRSNGFQEPLWSILSLLLLVLLFALLAKALQVLPLGTAYAVWTGMGAIGTLALGIAVLGESAAIPRLGFAALTIIGILGLKATG